MTFPGKLGRDEARKTGPKAGDGASSVGGMVAGGSDMEGTPPDELPSRPGESIYNPGGESEQQEASPGKVKKDRREEEAP